MIATDLLGDPVDTPTEVDLSAPSPKRKPTKPNGYAAEPGTGPQGETCQSCKYIARKDCANTYLKCWLRRKQWTGGTGTDIRAKSPACRFWEKREDRQCS